LNIQNNIQKNNTDAHCPNDEPIDISEHGDFVWTVDPNNYDVKYALTGLVCWELLKNHIYYIHASKIGIISKGKFWYFQ
jgi:hypothetical protein